MMDAANNTPTILCIEDEKYLLEDLRDELQDAGYNVHEAIDGKDGIEKIVAIKPDLVISDITMPTMTGYELVTELRNNHPEFAEMPFIFLSALADRDNVLQGMKVGADDYLTKPIDYDMLLTKIETRLRQTGRMAQKKQEEYVKLYKALTTEQAAKSQSGKTDADKTEETFTWRARHPKNVALVGESSDSLWDLQQLFRDAGHHVTVFTSGRAYLSKVGNVKPDITFVFPQTDDMNAAGVTKMLDKESTPHILVITPLTTNKAKAVKSEGRKNPFKGELSLPMPTEEIANNFAKWLK